MADNDKKEWQKKIPEFTKKFVHDDALEIGVDIYGHRKFVDIYPLKDDRVLEGTDNYRTYKNIAII